MMVGRAGRGGGFCLSPSFPPLVSLYSLSGGQGRAGQGTGFLFLPLPPPLVSPCSPFVPSVFPLWSWVYSFHLPYLSLPFLS